MATVASRNRGAGCPACSGRVPIVGKNDLLSQEPEIAKEWDYEKNYPLTPANVTCHSNKSVWWICSTCGERWEARIAGRTTNHRGCPVCAGVKVIRGVNDLKSNNTKLSEEWDYSKNGELRPECITRSSGKKVWWRCNVCGYSWSATVASRNSGAGCPRCARALQTSFPEQALFFYIKKVFDDAVSGYKPEWMDSRSEIDVFVPSINLGIEYDGQRWHKNTKKDEKKNKQVLAHNIQLIRVREMGLPPINDGVKCIYVQKKDKGHQSLEKAIKEIIGIIEKEEKREITIDVSVERDALEIEHLYKSSIKEKSIAYQMPEVLDEWDAEKNAQMSPTHIAVGSDVKIWWKCRKCGYSWQAKAYDRRKGSGCPSCAGKVVTPGVNDFQTKHPEVALEWDDELNGNICADSVAEKTNKKVWWKCKKCGYIWKARVADRAEGVGCPACKGRIAVKGKTDLASKAPEIAEEWDYHKNPETITPTTVTWKSNKQAWWICRQCGHSWQTPIYSRSGGRGCPECAKRKRRDTILKRKVSDSEKE